VIPVVVLLALAFAGTTNTDNCQYTNPCVSWQSSWWVL
jgi:hypothetical protein